MPARVAEDLGKQYSITDNEIAHNNPTGAVDPQFEAGGGKCTGTTIW